MSSPWVVHKFGGTSLADAERFRRVAAILRAEEGERKAIVVSAMGKVTDALVELIEQARARDENYLERLEDLQTRHLRTMEALLPPDRRESFSEVLASDFKDIRELLRGVYLSRTCSDRTLELITGHGELWSAQLLNAYLNSEGIDASYLDARGVLIVEPGESAVSVDWTRSQAQTAQWLPGLTSSWIVITGFVASTPEGIPTTLKRNGSDFSASIFGKIARRADASPSGRMSMESSAPIRASCRTRLCSKKSPTRRRPNWLISGRRWFIRTPWRRRSRTRFRSGFGTRSIRSHPGTKIHQRSASGHPVKDSPWSTAWR